MPKMTDLEDLGLDIGMHVFKTSMGKFMTNLGLIVVFKEMAAGIWRWMPICLNEVYVVILMS